MKKPTSGDEILLNSGLIAVIIKQNGYEPNGIVWYEIHGMTGVLKKQNTTTPCLTWCKHKEMWVQCEDENLMGV